MSDLYILNDAGEPERCDDVLTWGHWFENAERRRLARTEVVVRRGLFRRRARVEISTIFLGLDHGFGFGADARPVLWETMVFGGALDGEQWRYRSRAEALAGHAQAVAWVRAGRRGGDE